MIIDSNQFRQKILYMPLVLDIAANSWKIRREILFFSLLFKESK